MSITFDILFISSIIILVYKNGGFLLFHHS